MNAFAPCVIYLYCLGNSQCCDLIITAHYDIPVRSLHSPLAPGDRYYTPFIHMIHCLVSNNFKFSCREHEEFITQKLNIFFL